ncbi:hypothetical protein [Dyadobacter psychrotolerans]|uniref:Uncharacterized protein n=1 Tax=Dyadobacter psychrotolerans TaxID=2541721 RepID=A0A4R5D7T9_9BACT|nr:hypothetical protein [Dyadobacter psychrotolerans]TDE09589.1 hypothetical protein E0F88_30335 [Dyadobacter psychrotolerans]
MVSPKICKWLLLYGFLINLLGCEFVREESRKEEIFALFGSDYNKQRVKLKIPILPDNDWLPSRVVFSGDVGECDFTKKTTADPREDSSSRHAKKEVYFLKSNIKPIRETDLYYSGRRFSENDPDYYGWERLEIDYDYVNDTISTFHRRLINEKDNNVFVQGRRQAFLFAPITESATSNQGFIEHRHLKSKPISLSQADSVLKAWSISRF